MDGVVSCLNSELSACDIDISDSGIFIIFRMQAVLVRRDIDRTVRDQDGIIGFQSVRGAGDVDRTACHLEIILAADAVVGGVYIEGARTVHDQIISGEDDSVCVGITVCCECS